MTPRARARLTSIVVVIAGLALAAGLALYGLSGNITFFYTPTDIQSGALSDAALQRTIRIGGMVKDGSIERQNETVRFVVTDYQTDLNVVYRGILPDLFREGQGTVAYGRYAPEKNLFTAERILAKHDENYMPPEVKKALERKTP